MTEEIKKASIQDIKNAIDTTSRLALNLDCEEVIDKQEYNSEDLFNSLSIFNHVMSNISCSYQSRKGLTIDQVSIIAQEIGKNLRQTVQLATGIDTHALAQRLINKGKKTK